MNRFHAHIYFEYQNLNKARKLMELASISSFFEYQELYEKPIGPHPFGMIELHFNDQTYNFSLDWLKSHHETFSTLIHQDTGDDLRDHTFNILWLGFPLKINFEFFELIKKYPELSIHQKITHF